MPYVLFLAPSAFCLTLLVTSVGHHLHHVVEKEKHMHHNRHGWDCRRLPVSVTSGKINNHCFMRCLFFSFSALSALLFPALSWQYGYCTSSVGDKLAKHSPLLTSFGRLCSSKS